MRQRTDYVKETRVTPFFLTLIFFFFFQRATSPFTLSFPFFLGLPVYIPLALTVMLLVLVAQGVVCAESYGIYMVATARGFWNSLNFSWQCEISLTKWINNFTNYSSAAASSSGASFFAGRGEGLVMNRKGPWEGYGPSRLPLRALFHRERDVWVNSYE